MKFFYILLASIYFGVWMDEIVAGFFMAAILLVMDYLTDKFKQN